MSHDQLKPDQKRVAFRMKMKKRLVKAVEEGRTERVEEEVERDARDEEVRKRLEQAVLKQPNKI